MLYPLRNGLIHLHDGAERFRLIFIGDEMPSLLSGTKREIIKAWFVGNTWPSRWYLPGVSPYERYPEKIRTNGKRLWFEDVLIGWTRANGRKALLDYTARSGQYRNGRMSRYILGIERLASRYCPELDLYNPTGPLTSTGIPKVLKPLISSTPKIRLKDGLRVLVNERAGDRLRW